LVHETPLWSRAAAPHRLDLTMRTLGSDCDPSQQSFEGRSASKAIDLSLSARVFVLAALLSLLYCSIIRDMVMNWWDDPNYSHGFLVPLFSGYLVWLKRGELRRLRPQPNWAGFVMLLAGIATLILGAVGADNYLMRSSAIIVLAGLVLFHLGTKTFHSVAFAIAFLIFMVPLPQILFNAVTFPLQRVAAEGATRALDLLGVPVLRDGNVIHLSRVSLGVSEACSGIRSLISLLAIAVAWGYLSLPGLTARAVLVAVAVPAAIVANTSRIVTTGLIAQWLGVRYAEGFFHTSSGLVAFLVACAFLLLGHRLISVAAGHSRPS
jgi:exosortase